MTPVEYSEQEITDCLMAVIAWAGNCTAAHNYLESEGKRTPHYSTLHGWIRGRYAERYDELREKFRDQLELNLANEYRDVARLAVEVQRKALGKALDGVDEDKDPSRTAANAATVADKMTGKLLALTGRPTSIREDRNTNELLRSLIAMGVLKPPDEPEPVATISEGSETDGSMRRDDE